MMTSGSRVTNALSLAAVFQRCWLAPCLVLVNASMACRHVRVVMPLSLPARYALAIWRFSTGWRSELFLAWMICLASSVLVVPSLETGSMEYFEPARRLYAGFG